MNGRLGVCLALSALLHALLIGVSGFGSRSSAGSGRPDGDGHRILVRLKTISTPPVAVAVQEENAVMPAPVEPAEPLEPGPAPVTPVPDPVQASSPTATVPDHPVETPGGTEASLRPPVPLPILPATLPTGFDRDAYFPGSALDVRPTPEQPVVIDFDDPSGIDRKRGQIVIELYIGADGRVDRAEIGHSDLPEHIGERVADVFRAARMRPGMKDGQAVRAKMKVQVEFEVR